MNRLKGVATAAIGLLVLGGAAAAKAPSIAEGAVYVAMGSSYAAGPGITRKADDSPSGCSQSQDNYARQFARAHRLKLIDRSCGGAVTANVLKTGQYGLPPQIDGVTSETRLVTVTIGGNDIRYMADFATAVCRLRPDAVAEALRTQGCAAPKDFVLEQAFAATAENLRKIAAEVRRRAPRARLVFIDYVTVLPAGPPCAAISVSAKDADDLRARAERLARLTEQVAKETGSDLIKASDLTRAHNACAADPWIAGFIPPGPPGWGALSFHPKLAAMTAIAEALDRTLLDDGAL